MSQIWKPVESSPSVATTYTADSGSATPAANNLNIFGNDTTTYDADGLSTSGSGSTITVLLNNRVQGTASTVGAVTGDVITFAMGATPGTYRFDMQVAGFESTTPAGAGFGVQVCARTTGAAATVIDVDITPQLETALDDTSFTAVASANNIIFRVTGQAALTVNWAAYGTYERAI